MLKKLVLAVTLAAAFAAPAHAESGSPVRDSGVGPLIAAQGNQALALIRAELREALRTWAPALPAKAEVQKVRLVGAPAPAAVRSAP